MTDHLGDLSCASGTNLAVEPFKEIKTTTNKLPSPTFITQTMIPEFLSCKWRNRVCGIPHETTGGMSVECEHERHEQMMRIPKRFEGLLPDAMVGGCIHQHHAY